MTQHPTRPDGTSESLRARILREVDRRPDVGYGLYHLLVPYGQLALVWAGLAWTGGTVAIWPLWFVLIGWTQYRLYFPLHEVCHETLFPGALANRIVGTILAATHFSSFETFTALHLAHHRLYGSPTDPGSVDYHVHFRSRGQAARFFFAPLCGFSIVEKVWTNVVRPALGLAIPPSQATETRGADVRVARPTLADLVWLVVVQGLVATGFWLSAGTPLAYVVLFVLPEGTIFLFLARLRMYLEHGPLDYAVSDYEGPNRRRIARTHPASGLERHLLSYMHFHLHNEHHLVPSVPSCRLPDVARHLGMERLDADDFSPRYATTLRRLVRLAFIAPS